MNLSAIVSNLILTILVACLMTGCSPTESETGNSPHARENVTNEKVARKSVAKESGAKESVAKETGAKESVAKETGVPENTTADKLITQPSEPVVVNDPEFHEALVAAANEYLEYGMVNATALAAPADCAPASDGSAPKPLMSHSDDDTTHGHKLYYLFANEVAHYLNQDGSPSPIGQALVKESWTSKPSNPGARNLRNHASGNRINPRTKFGDETLEIGKRKDLFLMIKLATDTPGTDQGWVYGIVNPESKEVTESGKVSSCIQCHQDAKNDRLFGPANLSL